MFGYVRPPLQALPQEEKERFRRMYCGLCHALGRQYGQAARFILNYDFTYLAILLSEPEEGPVSSAAVMQALFIGGRIWNRPPLWSWPRMRA